MATWAPITVDNLNEYQAARLVAAARTKALASGQADPFLAVMPDVVLKMRDDIAESGVNQLSATANSVPPSLRGVAVLLTIEAMQPRLPSITIDEDLRILINDAKARMLRIAKGKPVETPDDPIADDELNQGGDIDIVGDHPRQVTRETMASI